MTDRLHNEKSWPSPPASPPGAARFPVWAISYGNAEIDLEALVKLVERFRSVVAAEEIRYTHLTGLSGDSHRERNRELLVVARR